MKGTHTYLHECSGEEMEITVDYDYTPEVKPRYNCEPSEDDAPYGPEVDIIRAYIGKTPFYLSGGLSEKIADDIMENI